MWGGGEQQPYHLGVLLPLHRRIRKAFAGYVDSGGTPGRWLRAPEYAIPPLCDGGLWPDDGQVAPPMGAPDTT
jgi:hypothetical protein